MNNFIGKPACDFTTSVVMPDGSIVKNYNLYDNIKGNYALLFFYPMDFTFVCPSELIAINNRMHEFESRDIKVLGISIDSAFVHRAWRETAIEAGGIGKVSYPLVSDVKKFIIKSYGLEDENSGVSYRGSFIIDKNMIIRSYSVNDFPIGRNIDEYIRLFDALAFHTEHGDVCQAGWSKGAKGIEPSSEGVSSFLASNFKKL